MSARIEYPIRLGGNKDMARFIGPHVDITLDGKPVDTNMVCAVDEADGRIDFLVRKEAPIPRLAVPFVVDRNPITGRVTPRLNTVRGEVVIRLRDTAPPGVRAAYIALRAKEPREAERIRRQ
jgi:hypothetical protein